MARSGKTTDPIKKVRVVQKWDGPPLSPYGGDRGSHAGCRWKTLWNYEVSDNGNAM